MFGIGGFELFLILLFAFLIFGPDKLPALAKTVGQAIGKFRDAQAEMTEQLKLDELLKQSAEKPGAQAAGAKAAGESAKAPAAAAANAAGTAQADDKPLSFSERKARYEAERAARGAAAKDVAAMGGPAVEGGGAEKAAPAERPAAAGASAAAPAPAGAPDPEEASR